MFYKVYLSNMNLKSTYNVSLNLVYANDIKS